MRIIHYTLGIYPNRLGGLNRYVTDLVREQMKEHDVAVLMPGPWRPWRKACRVSNGRKEKELIIYRLVNALPQPLLYGIKNPHDFIGISISRKSFEVFFKKVKPEILHLHTLMGMPEQVLVFFKEKGVRIVYTSHDYFGICPKVNFITENGELCEGPGTEKCARCNANAPSTLFLRMRSSSLAFRTRDLIKWLKNSRRF